MIAEAALQEDVDAIGLSILSGAHMSLVPRILDLLKENGQENLPIFLGGIIPQEDIPVLLELGVTAVFGPGAYTTDVVEAIQNTVLKPVH